MPIFLHGLRLKNYRGIGAVAQAAAPFKACNFFIGANNTGKSIFLNFISTHFNKLVSTSSALAFSPWEVHVGRNESEVEVEVAVLMADVRESCAKRLPNMSLVWTQPIINKILDNISDDKVIWLKFGQSGGGPSFAKSSGLVDLMSINDWVRIWQAIYPHRSGGTVNEHWIPQVLLWIMGSIPLIFPNAYLIPAMRRIGDKGDKFEDYSGKGLIEKLSELQNPGPADRALYTRFKDINGFLKDVTSDDNVQIEVPFNRQEILVHKDDRVLPLSSLGTGIHEVVMIAAFCTLIEESIVCVEEPEVHLHPLLQKKLLKYLTERTSNQYFIATHSASIIDQPGSAVFHVTHKHMVTNIELASDPSQRFKLCHDLGYRASDLLQTNFIVWVEGPTDRIYLNHWISSIDKELQEGIHYSIMFYGGRLLSHLSADDSEVGEFIALRRLNQNIAIVIDSDKKNSNSRINDAKKRVIAEFEKTGHIAWVTAGREIENYISPAVMGRELLRLYPSFERVLGADRFDHRLDFIENVGNKEKVVTADKIKVARAICGAPAELDILDLRKRVSLLVSRIRQAN
ncbi:AAA family ATPase [Pseudoduganella sp. FT26W]|uniref:AAA family ATPase n=1 Tax=Duganella aquatilis TaxID=2666082 RepID=A0A844D2Z3_9BURK|nr:AAA family ATPase [Duganella aquatilis]MRW83042.1 AAA family ATPase [Duganella aquatilis]